jgi:hypothetical protein
VAQCRLEQAAKQLRHLNEARLVVSRACNRVAQCRLEQARQLRHLNEAKLMAGRAQNRAGRCRLRARPWVKRAALKKEDKVPMVKLLGSLARLRVKRAAREKEGKVHTVKLLGSLARLKVKRGAREKEGRARMVNLPGSQKVERLPELSVVSRSQSAERKKRRKNHRRQGHNKSRAIIVAASGRKIPEPLFSYLFCNCYSGSCVSCNSIAFAGDTPSTIIIQQFARHSTLRL